MKLYCEICDKVFDADKPVEEDVVRCPECGAPILYPATTTSPGAVVGGDFLIEKLLGMGGMGEVFLAKQISLDRKVALKVLLKKYANNKEYVDGLIQEARAAAKLNHPNIVQAYAVGQEGNIVYFAMEYVPGKTFKHILREQRVLDFNQAAKVVKEIASALEFAWNEQKLVHQDIKPDNIMLDNSGRAKLADLGLARNANTESDEDSDEVLGTPQYISPEQLTGVPTDVRSDIYSLGATFYQFVTGRFAYVAPTPDEIAKLHVTGTLEPPKQVNPKLPDELNAIILKMMARDISQRYQTPQALIKALDIYLRHHENSNEVPSLKFSNANTVTGATTITKKPLTITAKPAMMKSLADKPAKPATAKPPLMAKPIPKATPVVPKATPVIVPKATQVETPEVAEKPKENSPEPPKDTTPASPVVSAPAEPEKEDQGETQVEKKSFWAIFSFLSNKAVIISLIAIFGVVLLLAIISGTFYALHRAGKLPAPLKPWGEKIALALSKGENTSVQVAPPKETPKTKNVEPPPPPKPVSRTEYLAKAQKLIDWNRSNPGSNELCSMVEEQWNYLLTPITPQESAMLAKVGEIWSGSDENYRFAPARQKMREVHRSAVAKRRQKIEDEARAQRELQEQARLQAQQLKAWEEEAKRNQAEIQRQTRERIAKNLQELEIFYPQLTEALFQLAITGDKAPYQSARQAVYKFTLPPTANTPEEIKGLRALRSYAAGIPKAASEIRNFIEKLEKITRNDGWRIVIPKNRTGLLHSIRPGAVKMVKPGSANDLTDLPLNNPATNRAFFTLLEKNVSPNARFYYGIMNRQFIKDMDKQIPKGFWKTYWQRIKTTLR